MRPSRLLPALLALAACSSSSRSSVGPGGGVGDDAPVELRDPREIHLANIKQLTNGGENAEAYWSFDGTQLIFQTKRPPYACDQIMTMPADGSAEPTLVSTGEGRTTCSYFLQGDQDIVYASTHETDKACPPEPDHSQGYVWAIYDSYEIYRARADGSGLTRLTDRVGYDAEATVCATDGTILFTSDRDGDLELYSMKPDGSDVVRLTHTPGYDGGAFFSADCTKIVWRASRPVGAELTEFQRLLGLHLVRPGKLEIYVANADGTDARQLTYLDAASFAPYLFPSGDRVIFSSNVGDPKGREFDLWAVDVDGTNLEQITYSGGFDGFPMFSPDGTQLAFASNRHNATEGDTNVFVAQWVDAAPVVEAASAADRFDAAVRWLADDARQGRGPGTQGLRDAADWIEHELRQAGVAGGMPDGSYRQGFEVTTAVERGDSRMTVDGKPVALDGFVPLTFSKPGALTGKTVYVGHGVVDQALGIDDYKGKQVKGKVVVVRRFVPDGKPFDDDAVRRRHGDLHTKAITARVKGAIGMIVVDVPEAGVDEAPLPALDRGEQDLGITAVAVTRAVGEPLLEGSHAVTAAVDLQAIKTTVDNLVAVVRAGASATHDGVVVVGAHYDHLGMGGRDSLEAQAGVHNGADDNASGTAALLEIARILQARRGELARDVYLVAFTAEEMGVLGSTHFVKSWPTDRKVVAMLNMDMVGRLRGNELQVLGAESAAEWAALVAPACATERVSCALSGGGHGPSDHMPFYVAGSPVLHFFTGSHLDYHRTSDDAPAINAIGGARVAAVVAETAVAVAGHAAALTYKQAPPPPQGGDMRMRGASLGTIPTYAEEQGAAPGVVISDVVPDGPAAKAGLKGGDRIVAVGTLEIRSIHDLMYVLSTAKPGDPTRLTFVRDGKRVTVDATFGKPRRR